MVLREYPGAVVITALVILGRTPASLKIGSNGAFAAGHATVDAAPTDRKKPNKMSSMPVEPAKNDVDRLFDNILPFTDAFKVSLAANDRSQNTRHWGVIARGD
jgi:hypothetical protein